MTPLNRFWFGENMTTEGNFERLMVDTYPRIFKFVLKLAKNEETAKDLCQETYIRAYKNQNERKLDRDPMPYFFKIAYNCFLDNLRMQSRRPKSVSYDLLEGLGFEGEFADPKSNPEQILLDAQISSNIRNALSELPKNKQDLIRLSVIESMSYGEIAEMYSCSIPAIRTRIHRAVDTLRQKLTAKELKLVSVDLSAHESADLAA